MIYIAGTISLSTHEECSRCGAAQGYQAANIDTQKQAHLSSSIHGCSRTVAGRETCRPRNSAVSGYSQSQDFHGGNDETASFRLCGARHNPNHLGTQLGGGRRRDAATYLLASISKHCNRNAVRSRGITFSARALCAHSCCLSCSARRFSAASRYSGATAVGSTSFWAKAGTIRTSETSATRMREVKIISSEN
jgi:hypothetical protein